MRDIAEILRVNIRTLLKQRGMFDADLARAAGITKTYVSQLLRDEPEGRNDNPGLKQLARIAEALGTTVARLLSGPQDRLDPMDAINEVTRLLKEVREVGAESPEIRKIFGMGPRPPKK